MKNLSVVIPVFNEVGTVANLIQRVADAPLPAGIGKLEIIAVDDCSSDGSGDVLDQLVVPEREDGYSVSLVVLHHEKNRGKGAALRTAFAHVSGDLILIQDADLEYDPSDYPALLDPLVTGQADVVYGSRFLGGGSHRVLFYWHYVGNRFLTMLSNAFTNINLSDMETCYKVFTRDVLDRLSFSSDRFGFEVEFTARVSRLECRIYEVGISYHGRTYADGKKIGWKDGMEAVWCILKFNIFDRH